MNQKTDSFLCKELNRSQFIKYSFSVLTMLSLPVNLLCNRPKTTTTKLTGLSPDTYLNINSAAEVFLKDSPVPGFDTGAEVDRYLYGRPNPPQIEKKLLELLSLPSSVLAAVLFDFSFTSMRDLPVAEREKRLMNWKYSSLGIKRTVYNALRQLSLMMLTSSKKYQEYCGYKDSDHFRPFVKK